MKPIAMKCTQQDWEDIKPILEKHKLQIINICQFKTFNYLVNNYNDSLGIINNVTNEAKNTRNRTVYEQWDKNIFLEACDIIVKEDFKLPAQWCVKQNISKIICDWANKNGVITAFIGGKYKYIIYDNGKTLLSNNIFGIEITYEQFCKYVLKQEIKTNMDNRFPFKLNSYDAQKIINIACSTWMHKLATMWGPNIVVNRTTEISEQFYKEMRNACTVEQNTLFDSIFGKDDVFKKDDLVVVTGTTTYNYGLSIGSLRPIVGKTYKYLKYTNGLARLEVDSLNRIAINNSDLRLATEEEVKAFNSYQYKDGELVFVKSHIDSLWGLRYTNGVIDKNGNIECYDGQKTTGSILLWRYYKPAPGIILPD